MVRIRKALRHSVNSPNLRILALGGGANSIGGHRIKGTKFLLLYLLRHFCRRLPWILIGNAPHLRTTPLFGGVDFVDLDTPFGYTIFKNGIAPYSQKMLHVGRNEYPLFHAK